MRVWGTSRFWICVPVVAMVGCGSGVTDYASPPLPVMKRPARQAEVVLPDISSSRPWQAPARGFPKPFLKATSLLLNHGLPDPRGRLFVLAQVREFNLSQGQTIVQPMYGWTISGSDDKPMLIGLDGLAHMDVQSFSPVHDNAHPDFRLDPQRQLVGIQGGYGFGAPPAAESLSDPGLAAALLLVAGRTTDAKTALGRAVPSPNAFLDMADDLLRAKWEQCVGLYARADDDMAAPVAAELLDLRSKYQTDANGLKEGPAARSRFAYLDQAQAVSDQTQTNGDPPKNAGNDAVTRQIVELKNVGDNRLFTGSHAKSGFQTLAEVTATLRQEPNKSAKALLDDISDDGRVCRQFAWGKETWRLVPVSELARQAFLDVTNAPLSPNASESQLREWWHANGNLPDSEWNFRTLADDNASPEQWQAAAQRIAGQPVVDSGSNSAQPLQPKMQEDLRVKTKPSVSDLMKRRIQQLTDSGLAPRKPPYAGEGPELFVARYIIGTLRNWDRKAGDQIGRALDDRLLARAQKDPSWKTNGYSNQSLIQALADRIRAGDSAAPSKYMQVVSHSAQRGLFLDPQLLEYYGEHRTESRFNGFAKQILLDPVLRIVKERSHAENLWTTQPAALMAAQTKAFDAPEEQEAITLLLNDKAEVGVITTNGQLASAHIGKYGGESWGNPVDTKSLPEGKTEPYRVCDMVMEHIRMVPGIGDFQPFWRTDLKDAAIAKTVALITARRPVTSDVPKPHSANAKP